MLGDMDQPPLDHGSDRYDYIEVDAPDGETPPPWMLQAALEPCGDCRANTFFRWEGPAIWRATIAHDETCPTMAQMDGRPDVG